MTANQGEDMADQEIRIDPTEAAWRTITKSVLGDDEQWQHVRAIVGAASKFTPDVPRFLSLLALEIQGVKSAARATRRLIEAMEPTNEEDPE